MQEVDQNNFYKFISCLKNCFHYKDHVFKKIIFVFIENHTIHINTNNGQNVELINV